MILKFPRVLQHRLKVHELVWRVVSAELEEVLDYQAGKRKSRLYAIKRDAAMNIEYRSSPDMIQVRVRKRDRLHLFRRDVHWEPDVMVYHYTIIKNEVLSAHADCECGPAYFL